MFMANYIGINRDPQVYETYMKVHNTYIFIISCNWGIIDQQDQLIDQS